jgi:hypothetical protein
VKFVLKIIHNEHIALLWALAVEIVVHGFFGLQAFLLGGFLGEVALVKIFGPDLGVQIGAWSLGVLIFGMAFVSFVLGEYLKSHVQSFIWAGKGGKEYMDAFKETAKMAIGLELSSLAFRVLTVGVHEGDWPSAIVIAIAGCIGLRYAVMMAKVIHASVNRDVAYDLLRSQDQAAQTLAEKARKYTKHMTPAQLAGWSEGDASALEEAASSGFFAEEQKRQAKESKKHEKQSKVEAKRQQEWDAVQRDSERQEEYQGHMQGARILISRFRGKKHVDTPKTDPPFTAALSNQQANHQSQGSSNGHRK